MYSLITCESSKSGESLNLRLCTVKVHLTNNGVETFNREILLAKTVNRVDTNNFLVRPKKRPKLEFIRRLVMTNR